MLMVHDTKACVWRHINGTGQHADGKQNHTDGLQRHLDGILYQAVSSPLMS